jgi:hypothetical protein
MSPPRANAFKSCVNISRLCKAAISKRERCRCIPVRERKGLALAPRKGLKRKARTTTAGRRRTCSGKPDRRVERGLRPNVLTGTLPFTVLYALAPGNHAWIIYTDLSFILIWLNCLRDTWHLSLIGINATVCEYCQILLHPCPYSLQFV